MGTWPPSDDAIGRGARLWRRAVGKAWTVTRVRDLVTGMAILVDGKRRTIAARGIKSTGGGRYALTFTDGMTVELRGRDQVEVVDVVGAA